MDPEQTTSAPAQPPVPFVADPPTAQRDQGPTFAPSPEVETSAPQTATVPTVAAPQAPAPQPVPVILKPTKRGGILGVIDDIGDALAGRTRPVMATDDQGNRYVQENTLTHGQQWARIGEEALRGGAAGFAAGRGAGNMGRAPLAGIEAADQMQRRDDQQRQQMRSEAEQDNADHANALMLRINMAKAAWQAQREKVKATQEDVNFANGQEDRITKAGGTLLGTAAHEGDIGGILGVNPELMPDLIQRHQIEIQPHYNSDGSYGGIRVFKMPNGYRTTMLPAGTEFPTFDGATGKYVMHKASDPMTAGELEDFKTAAATAATNYSNNKNKQNLTVAQTREANARVPLIGAQAVEARTGATKNLAEANKANADAAHTRSVTLDTSAGSPQQAANAEQTLAQLTPQAQALVKEFGEYRGDLKTLPFKGDSREKFMGLVAQVYPNWNQQEYDARKKFLTDWRAGSKNTMGANRVSLNQGIGHIGELNDGLHELKNTDFRLFNEASNLAAREFGTGHGAIGKVTTAKTGVTSELASIFKGTGATDQEIKAWDKSFNESSPKTILDRSVPTALAMMSSRMAAIQDAWRQNMPGQPVPPMLNDQSRAVLAKIPGGAQLIALDSAGAHPGAQPAATAAPQTPQPAQAAPQTHVFSVSAWLRANPGGDAAAARSAAEAQHFQVVQ